MVIDATGEFAIVAFRAGNAFEEVGRGEYHLWREDLSWNGRCWKCAGECMTTQDSMSSGGTFNDPSQASCKWLSRESQKHACKGQDVFVQKVQSVKKSTYQWLRQLRHSLHV